jgi:hypothetical protein
LHKAILGVIKNMAKLKIENPVIKMPPNRINQTLAFGKKYVFGTIIGIPSTATGSHSSAVGDVWSSTNSIPVGIITAHEGVDLSTATANTVCVIGAGETEMDYDVAVRLNPYLATIPGVMNGKLDQRFTNILITKKVKL